MKSTLYTTLAVAACAFTLTACGPKKEEAPAPEVAPEVTPEPAPAPEPTPAPVPEPTPKPAPAPASN